MRFLPLFLSLVFAPMLLRGADPTPPRERISLNADWRFQKDDPAGAREALSYGKLKPALIAASNSFLHPEAPATAPSDLGQDVPYTQPGFDDGGWRALNLPHDWGIEGPFRQEYPGETGKLPWWGVGWYRKSFDLPAADAGRRISLEVDGAMSFASVWCNGKFVGGWPYGYASWQVDLTPFLKPGGKNVLAIRLDNPPDSSRWYPGGGIYRNVWLVKTGPVHVAPWGVFVTTPEMDATSATVSVKATVENQGGAAAVAHAEIRELDPAGAPGRVVAQSPPVTLAPGDRPSVELLAKVERPRRWSIEHPDRYVAVTVLEQNGVAVDRCETPFGIRTVQFTADRGLLINGEHVPLRGVCDHHDLGALGAAINLRALERQVEILKGMGCNALRTSHNPPAPELLDLCDRLGMVVMDELTDTWRKPKKPNGYAMLFDDWHEKDLRALVRRDRNHPSVILWSLGNEIPEQGTPAGNALEKELSAIAHSEDPTRPTAIACSNTAAGYSGFQNGVDVFGYNYRPGEYAKFRAQNPAIPLIGSETASTVSSRGEYFFPVSDNKAEGKADFQMSSYDLYAPPWATPPDWEFKGQDSNPFVAGEFVWTGFDYLGEPTPYNADSSNLLNFTDSAEKQKMQEELARAGRIHSPSRSSYFGIIDLAGFPKDRYYLYQARWRPDLPMAHLLPHWTWPGREGEVTPVHLYTSGDEAELFLNGQSLGRKARNPLEYRLRWDDVKYQPGELRAVAYKGGRKWAEDVVRTAGPAAGLTLKADRATLRADGQDLAYVTVAVTDKDHTIVPRAKNLVNFELTGPGEILAVDNGDATSFEPFQARQRRAYNGLALVIVRTRAGAGGAMTLRATSDGLAPVEVELTSKPSL